MGVRKRRAPVGPAYTAMLEEARLRRVQALELRDAGNNLREIGEILGVSHQRAQQIILAAERDRERAKS